MFLLLVLISVRGSVNPKAIVRLERLGKLKEKSITSPRLEPATFGPIEECLNQLPPLNVTVTNSEQV
jgi:hypothetical protein